MQPASPYIVYKVPSTRNAAQTFTSKLCVYYEFILVGSSLYSLVPSFDVNLAFKSLPRRLSETSNLVRRAYVIQSRIPVRVFGKLYERRKCPSKSVQDFYVFPRVDGVGILQELFKFWVEF